MNCRVCSIPLAPWGSKGNVPLLICRSCGSIHAQCAKPSEDLYADLYSKAEEVPSVIADSLDQVVRSLSPFRTEGRWLDVGFGQGALLEAAVRGGWRAFGTEASPVALEKGRIRGFVAEGGTQEFDDGTFDVVSLVELIEHVESPELFLKEARRVLRKGGCVWLTTPNAWSLNRWFLGDAWSVFAPPDHITIFTPRALSRLLQQAGFAAFTLRTEGLNPFEILARIARNGPAEDFNRAEAGTRLCHSLSVSRRSRSLKILANMLLRAMRVGDSLKARAS